MSMQPSIVLRVSLLFLGLALLIPGLFHAFFLYPFSHLISPSKIEGINQLRALNGMMAAVGMLCLWCIKDTARKYPVLHGLALILLVVSICRIYSLFMDGISNFLYLGYLGIEIVLAVVLLYFSTAKRYA